MQGFCFFIFSILVQYLWTLLKFFSSFDFLLQEKQLPNIFDASLFSIYNTFCHLNPISGLEYPQFHVLLNLVLIQKSTKKSIICFIGIISFFDIVGILPGRRVFEFSKFSKERGVPGILIKRKRLVKLWGSFKKSCVSYHLFSY